MTAAGLPGRYTSIPNRIGSVLLHHNKQQQPAAAGTKPNPYSFNSYSFKPAPQPANAHLPLDPVDLSRRLELHLLSLDSEDEKDEPESPVAVAAVATTNKDAVSTPTAAAAVASSASSSHLKPKSSRYRAVASPSGGNKSNLASPASPSPNAKAAALAATSSSKLIVAPTRSVTDPLPRPTTAPPEEQEARRAKKLVSALKGQNGPVEAKALAMRLSALTGEDAKPADAAGPKSTADLRKRLGTRPGSVSRLPQVSDKGGQQNRAKESAIKTGGNNLQEQLRLASIEHEREKARLKQARSKPTLRSSPPAGAIKMSNVTVPPSMSGYLRPQPNLAARPRSTPDFAQLIVSTQSHSTTATTAASGSGSGLRRSKSNMQMGKDSGRNNTSSNSASRSYASGLVDRPDWSQIDEEQKAAPQHRNLYVPGLVKGLSRRPSTAPVVVETGEKSLSDAEGLRRKKSSGLPNAKRQSRRSICLADVAKANGVNGMLLDIPGTKGSTVMLQPSLSPTSPPSITLSPVEPLSPVGKRSISPSANAKPSSTQQQQQQQPATRELPKQKPRPLSMLPERRSVTQLPGPATPKTSSSTPVSPQRRTKVRSQMPEPAPAVPAVAPWPGPQQSSGIYASSNVTTCTAGATGQQQQNKQRSFIERQNSAATAAAVAAIQTPPRSPRPLLNVPEEEGGSAKRSASPRRSVTFAENPTASPPKKLYQPPKKQAAQKQVGRKSSRPRISINTHKAGAKQQVTVVESESAGEERPQQQPEGLRSPAGRLVFWKKDSGGSGNGSKADDATAAAAAAAAAASAAAAAAGLTVRTGGGEDAAPMLVRSPSRLAFWKKEGGWLGPKSPKPAAPAATATAGSTKA